MNAPPESSSIVGNRDEMSSSSDALVNSKRAVDVDGPSLTKGSESVSRGCGLGVVFTGLPRLIGSTGRVVLTG